MSDNELNESERIQADPTAYQNWAVGVTRIVERQKTIRSVVRWTGIVIGTYFIVDGIVEIVAKPPWLKLAGLIVVVLIAPSGIIYGLIRGKELATNRRKEPEEPDKKQGDRGSRGTP